MLAVNKIALTTAVVLVSALLFTRSVVSQDAAPFLGHRASDDLPPLTDEELGSIQQQALLEALAGDPIGHRAADDQRAGCPTLIRPRAIPSNTRYYGGYWVGGGLPIHGQSPFADEGTFGWDYFGILFTKRVTLNWSHRGRYQGGIGRYRTDGPRLIHR